MEPRRINVVASLVMPAGVIRGVVIVQFRRWRGFEGNLGYVVIYENKTRDKTGGSLIDPA